MCARFNEASEVNLNNKLFLDIAWWLQLLQQHNVKHLIEPTGHTIHISTDACQTGAGIVCDSDWFYIDWEQDMSSIMNKHINGKETAAIVLSSGLTCGGDVQQFYTQTTSQPEEQYLQGGVKTLV